MPRTKILDVVAFATGPAVNTPLTFVAFSRSELDDPQRTIQALIGNPDSFRSSTGKDYVALMTRGQSERLIEYLKKGDFRKSSFRSEGEPSAILGLSFGEGPAVNEMIAAGAAAAAVKFQAASLHMQWELARLMLQYNGVDKARIRQIDLDADRDYITTVEVVDEFMRSWHGPALPEAYLVCQAWHAPRCISICEANGIKVVGGTFVDAFSPNDKQKWVRNWLALVLKEGTK